MLARSLLGGWQCLEPGVLACSSEGMREPAQCPRLPFAGTEGEQCPDRRVLLCSLSHLVPLRGENLSHF